MSDAIKVTVVEFGDRKHFQMQWRDPVGGRKKTKSTGVERTGRKRERTEAERRAAKFEAELREGRYHEPTRVTWDEFRERYEAEVLPGLADRTADKVFGVFNTVERVLGPKMLRDVTAESVSRLAASLRANGRAETTIAGHLAHLRAALRWAVGLGMLAKAPRIERPRRAKSAKLMKGRPITLEEFERMLDKTADVVGEAATASWRFYLEGLWCSGLRLAESLELWWDRDDRLCVDLAGKRPMLRIPAELEKGHKDRMLPMAPEFAEFLLRVPEGERTGRVFQPLNKNGSTAVAADWACHMASRIGRAAGVKVHTDPTTGRVKYASAHDLRRSFGERWAQRVMPQVLMELMRHESIETTNRFYVGRNAQKTADVLWEVHQRTASNTLGNSGLNRPNSAAPEISAS